MSSNFEFHEFEEFQSSKPPVHIQEIGSLSQSAPTRPVDWRWKLVSLATSYPELKTRIKNDPYLLQLFKFVKRVDEAVAKEDLLASFKIQEQEPDLFAAWCFYSHVSLRRLESELKARILAQEDSNQISKKLNVTVGSLDWYEKAFFNVLDRIDSPSYILHQAIFQGNKDFDLTKEIYLIPFLGFFFGTEAVDYYVYRTEKTSFMEFVNSLDERIKKFVQLRFWTLLNSEDKEIPNVLFKIYSNLQLSERGAGTVAEGLQTLLNQVLPFNLQSNN